WFMEFFDSPFFFKLLKNTVVLSFYTLLWGFPFPIIFALMLNEMKKGIFKNTVQSISYFPYFISVVVMVGILSNLFSTTNGIVNQVIQWMGMEPQKFLADPKWFRTLYVGSNVWQNFGFTSIIYLSALSAIDPQLYESSKIDGATRFQNIFKITIPMIMPTIIMMLILRMGNIMSIGFEKAFLMYKPSNASVSDILSLYVYRKGITNMEFSFATAIGLFNSTINCILLFVTNRLSKRTTQNGLW
ncbi:MAG: ABC transporter permease subunit, partial [Angelakisella sp.]